MHHAKCWAKKHKLESRMLGEIPVTSDMEMTPPLQQKAKIKPRSPILQANSLPAEPQGKYFMANTWGNSRNSDRLYFGGLQNHCRW